MNMISTIERSGNAAIEALRGEFGAVLAERIVEAEAIDFLWESRVRERYLGQHIGFDFEDEDASQELSRVAILSILDGRWYAGICLVDGEGAPVELIWKQSFDNRGEGEIELLRTR